MTPETFIARWTHADGSELANAQSFTRELCELLEVPVPDPARADTADNAYVFERRVVFRHGDGGTSEGRIDCYRRGAFVLEAKKLKAGAQTKGFDDGLLRARAQAENYARALPAEESRPPFVVVVDVGHVIELYAEFSRSGATYTPFPDPRSHRIRLQDLADDAVRARLKAVWLDPLALDPTRRTARATRQIATDLARVAQSLEGRHAPEAVAAFLTRCLFTMFAEDVGLLPKADGAGAFTGLLKSLRDTPGQFVPLVAELWRAMDSGDFSVAIRAQLPRFNGKLFKEPHVILLDRDQIDLLLQAAQADWSEVEPAIFGTLLEAALDPRARHDLGAHYTPRAYVERLVLPAVIEPLRAEWANTQAAALLLAVEGKTDAARAELHAFHHRLCAVRVLDPACGSGNFLYVTMEHMKRLEGEVLNHLESLPGKDLGQDRFDIQGLAVDPHQFLGLELNPRAAAIAEMVLWIGHLQWHYRTRGRVLPPTPILRDFRNIECRDAVLAHERVEFVMDATGLPVSRWDGRGTKPHPVTGEAVPDETARVPLERYANPRPAEWPVADYVVGNPPFIGASAMRQALGDGYTEALRAAWPAVPESADLVMYWWHHAAGLVRAGTLQRFGFITTNSIRQTFNRRVLEAALLPGPSGGEGASLVQATRVPPPLAPPPVGEGSLHLAFAIPDHPWVDSADGAAVRIAMTVGAPGDAAGLLQTVVEEGGADGDAVTVALAGKTGRIHADLSIGADVAGVKGLRANIGLANRGVQVFGAGFIVTPEQAAALLPATAGEAPDSGVPPFGKGGAGGISPTVAQQAALNPPQPPFTKGGSGVGAHEASLIRPYRNGRDLTDKPRGVGVIDLYGLSAEIVRQRCPAIYQWVLERVKPERDHNNRASYRDNWWLLGENQPLMRASLVGLSRYIVTTLTAKHRVFQFLEVDFLPDQALVAIGSDDAYLLGVLSSRLHVVWSLAAGGRLGMGNDPRYNITRCFDTFPFPDPTPEQQTRIRARAEELDAHRTRVLSPPPQAGEGPGERAGLTLTGLYNVLEKLRAGEPLTAKDKAVHAAGLVSVLKQLHDELDAAVLAAYGWQDLLPSPAGGGAGGREGGFAEHAPRPSSGSGMQSGTRSAGEGATSDADALLERLVALNARRRREEAAGQVRWLRPAFQNPAAQTALAAETSSETAVPVAAPEPPTKQPWPATLPEQVAAVARVLAQAAGPLAEADIAARFTGKGPWKKRLPQLLDTLAALGRARRVDGNWMG